MMAVFKRIVVPHDFSPSADAALAMAADLAALHGGSLRVLHVIPPIRPPHGRPLPPPSADVATARDQLAATVARVTARRKIRRVSTDVVVGAPAACIVAAGSKADAIVMGTLGQTGLARLLIGSVAERVVRHASVPVLTVRASARRRRR
jgi:nucleotide-binding universal stress UspA family protein